MTRRIPLLKQVFFCLVLLAWAAQPQAAGIIDFDPVKVNGLKKEGLSASWAVQRLTNYPQEKDWLDFMSHHRGAEGVGH